MKKVPAWAWFVFAFGSGLVGLGGFLPSDSYAQSASLQLGSVAMLLFPVVLAERALLSAFMDRVDDSIAIQESIVQEAVDSGTAVQLGAPEDRDESGPVEQEDETEPVKEDDEGEISGVASLNTFRQLENALLHDGWEMRIRGDHKTYRKGSQRVAIPLTPMRPSLALRRVQRALIQMGYKPGRNP
ncbi:hypothetical protein [Umezawaea tangerina]|uniref:hypothetical protein n=1 Tax=Umezawaea tangerina TaxID=84725 RepID=UPI0011B209E4|nr:hypothetical protein [Umezawaea tangerina]